MQYLGIDWGTGRAAWCALDVHGTLREGMVPADESGLGRLALSLAGEEVRGCIEMMSGAVWVSDAWLPYTVMILGGIISILIARYPCHHALIGRDTFSPHASAFPARPAAGPTPSLRLHALVVTPVLVRRT